jgi:cell division protein ZapA
MSTPKTSVVKALIFGKEFTLACPPNEEEALLQAVDMLNERIDGIKKSAKVVGTDRIALAAAINLSFDLIKGGSSAQISQTTLDQVTERISKLNQTIDAFINPAL